MIIITASAVATTTSTKNMIQPTPHSSAIRRGHGAFCRQDGPPVGDVAEVLADEGLAEGAILAGGVNVVDVPETGDLDGLDGAVADGEEGFELFWCEMSALFFKNLSAVFSLLWGW
jgi:hypothetical protein